MALKDYIKKIKIGLDTSSMRKELENLRKNREALDKERAEIEKKSEYEKYKKAQEEYNKQRKQLDELKKIKKSERTEEQNRQIRELEKSTSAYSDEALKRTSLYDVYKKYGKTEQTKEYNELFEYLERLEDIQTEIQKNDEKALEQRAKIKEASSKQALAAKAQQSFQNIMKGIGSKIESGFLDLPNKIGETLSDAVKEIKNMSAYSLSTSLKMNRDIREQALTYGLSDAQNYALTKAKEEIGAESIEDLYWMTPAQQERFSERIGYWTGQYNALADKDSLKTLEQLQAELNDIKTDFQMEVVQFIANNKDVIIWGMKTGVSILQKIMDGLSWLIGDTTKPDRESAISDAINNYSNTSNSQTNVKIDNSFNGVSTDNYAKLRKAGNEVNRQIIQALNGNL